MANWYCYQNGRQVGPVSLDQLRGWITSGAVRPEDPVWNETMPSWVPCRQVPELMGGGGGAQMASAGYAQAPGGYAPSPISYESAAVTGITLSAKSVETLRQTKPWARFMGVMIFVNSGLLALAAFGSFMIASEAFGRIRDEEVFVVVGIAYLVIAGATFPIGIFLNSYASHLGDLFLSGRPHSLEKALESQRTIWRYMGILAIIGLSIVVVFIFVAIAANA